MDDSTRRALLLRRMAWLCVVLVLAITSLSAFIRLTRAGLGCADWPACYGQALREQQQGRTPAAHDSAAVVAARIAHRVVASATLLLVAVMAMTCLGPRPRWWPEGRRALALLALALFLALLGRWSAAARVPAVTLGNLLAGFTMLALAWNLARNTGCAPRVRPSTGLRRWAMVAVAVLCVQIALGGLVSAGYAGLSCPDLAACDAQGVSWRALDPWHEPLLDTTHAGNPAGALLQQAHRLGALLLAALLLTLGGVALRRGPRAAGAALLALVAVQVALGSVLVVGALPLPVALGHNLVAGLLLAATLDLASPPLR
ncbi:MAG: COX15/CtaA family protein [Caldimonas sp.]